MKTSLKQAALSVVIAVSSSQFNCNAFQTLPFKSYLHKQGSYINHIAHRLNAAKPLSTFEPSDFAFPTGEWPYTDADMGRLDNTEDTFFYDTPRFVTHIDDRAIESLTEFYRDEIRETYLNKKKPVDIIDICSSWVSHLPEDDTISYGRVAGVGMNDEELSANAQLTEYLVKDLNKAPDLSEYEDNSFDILCNVVSVDYLTKPLPIFQETYRVLRPGGKALISFSNRCFPTKAVAMWLQADDIDRLTIVGSYFHYASTWKSIEALDIKLPNVQGPKRPSVQEIMANPSAAFAWASATAATTRMNSGDPMYVVKGVK